MVSSCPRRRCLCFGFPRRNKDIAVGRSEEHTSELQSHLNLVCRLLLEKKKIFQMRCSNDCLFSLQTTPLTSGTGEVTDMAVLFGCLVICVWVLAAYTLKMS